MSIGYNNATNNRFGYLYANKQISKQHPVTSRSRSDGLAIMELGVEAPGSGLSNTLKSVRGAAYMNDVGEGLKPTIGQALAKRFWYPALAYVGASVYDKTMRDKNGNKDFSLARGSKELAFQVLASLCGPILLVNLGQNTIGRALSGTGSIIEKYRAGQKPFANLTMKSALYSIKDIGKVSFNGICHAAKELPSDIWSTIKLGFKDLTHPKETFAKLKELCSRGGKYCKSIPEKTKVAYGKFKGNKLGYFFGKDGILFGAKGLLGEKGLLFGKKSSRVIGGLLAIGLLYKSVDKLAEKMVDIPEKIFK